MTELLIILHKTHSIIFTLFFKQERPAQKKEGFLSWVGQPTFCQQRSSFFGKNLAVNVCGHLKLRASLCR